MAKNENDKDNKHVKEIHDKFVAINEAYAVLSKPDEKRHYDLGLYPSDAHVHKVRYNDRCSI